MTTLAEAATIIDRDAVAAQRAAQREKNRERVARHRERKRLRDEIAALAEAERIRFAAESQERHDESVVSAALRKPIVTPTGYVVMGARLAVSGNRISRVDPLASESLSDRQRGAARKLQQDHREAESGAGARIADYGGDRGGGGDQPILGQDIGMIVYIQARTRLAAALAYAGAFSVILRRVVLDAVPLAVWAYQEGHTAEDALRWLGNALTRLALFYNPPVKVSLSTGRILTIAPARSEYDLSVQA
jgi:hypothetical protein